jgi:predicted SAM-dependent methyltransferase
MEIKIVKRIPGRSFKPGETVSISRQRGHKYIADGYAVEPGDYDAGTVAFNDSWHPAEPPKLTGELQPPRYICDCGFVAKSPWGLERHKKSHNEPLKLNLGCGGDIKEGFINVDCRPLKGVDVVADVSDLPEFENVGHILAQDIIEHFPQAETEGIIKRWLDILPEGGTLEIRCPDVIHASRVLSERGFIEMLYGSQDYPENFHRAGFTLATMTELLEGLGVEVEGENRRDGNLWVKATK